MTALPDPLVPADVDLTDYKYMPLYLNDLRRSKAWSIAKRNPEIGFYMINLWGAAWYEIPAGSLPNDHDLLADMAVCDPEDWDLVKDKAMHGWVLCSDNRWHHEFLSEKVMIAWEAKAKQRKRTEGARQALAEMREAAKKQKDDGDDAKRAKPDSDRTATSTVTDQPQPSAPPDEFVLQGTEVDEASLAFDEYNVLAKSIGLPIAQRLTQQRRSSLKRRLDEAGGLTGWRTALEKLRANRWMHGGNDRQWKADLDFLLAASKFTRLIEGGYDREGNGGEQGSGRLTGYAAALADSLRSG